MKPELSEVREVVRQMSAEDRDVLLEDLLAGLAGVEPEVTEEMAEELASRFARMDAGERVAAEDVLRRPSRR